MKTFWYICKRHTKWSISKKCDYRGTASPLLGESQGISVYLDGVRINESFGDTVQWELVPENAIKQIDLMSSNLPLV